MRATTAHGLHSPFVFDFYQKIIQNKTSWAAFSDLEKCRKQNLHDHSRIEVTDLGAGSKHKIDSKRSVSHITRHSSKNKRIAQLLFRTVKHFNPTTILDLGTSVGITTCYLAKANERAQIYSFEGCLNTQNIARRNAESLSIENISFISGNIDHTLSEHLKKINTVDLVLFDANHTYSATIRYFENCLEKAHKKSCFIFDDIYWSEEMKKAWSEIKAHERVNFTVDLFEMGFVFFDKTMPKQHFLLK
jgi:predicted O-methyltransferase YrrM